MPALPGITSLFATMEAPSQTKITEIDLLTLIRDHSKLKDRALHATILSDYKKSKIKILSGTILIEQGEMPNKLWLLIDGSVSMEWADSRGRVHDIYKCSPGEFIGLDCLINANSSLLRARAVSKIEVIPVTAEKLFKLISTAPELFFQLIRSLCGKLTELKNRTSYAGLFESVKRMQDTDICSTVREVSNRLQVPEFNYKDLANVCGTTQEFILFLIQELESDKLITIKKDRVAIRNFDKLKSLAG